MKTKSYHRLLIGGYLIRILFLNGCTPDYGDLITSPQTLPPAIFAFLNTAADSQYVVLSVVSPEKDHRHVVMDIEVPFYRQAKVWLEGESGPFSFERRYEVFPIPIYSWFSKFFWVSKNSVRPGETYWLRVEIPEKGLFTASTTAPGDFQILSPNPEDTLDVFSPIDVRWTAAKGAAAYRITVWKFIEDSSALVPPGWPDTVLKVWRKQDHYLEANPEPSISLKNPLTYFYTTPIEYVNLIKANLTIDALDEPAWIAYQIKTVEPVYRSDYRLEVVSYSNIEGGYGLMTATTSHTIPLLLPEGQK